MRILASKMMFTGGRHSRKRSSGSSQKRHNYAPSGQDRGGNYQDVSDISFVTFYVG